MNPTDAIWHWVNATGLYLKHKDLRPRQILELYGAKVINDGGNWKVRRHNGEETIGDNGVHGARGR